MFYSKSKMVLIGWIQAVSNNGRIIMPFTASLALRGGKENPHRLPMGANETGQVIYAGSPMLPLSPYQSGNM